MISVHTPKVTRILALGEKMTEEQIKYLIDREVSHDDIAQALKMTESDYNEFLYHLNGTKKRDNRGRKTTFTLTINEYLKLSARYLVDKEISEALGVPLYLLTNWKKRNRKELIAVLRKLELNQLLYLARFTSFNKMAADEIKRRESE